MKKEYKERISVTVPADLKRRVLAQMEVERRYESSMVSVLLEMALDKREKAAQTS